MTILMHDLAVRRDVRLSPYCWRVRLALEHKGLPYLTVPTTFSGISSIADGNQKTVPVIQDPRAEGTRIVADSWAIADYLENAYPDRPSLFGGDVGRSYAFYLQNWMTAAVLRPALKTVLLDIYANVVPEDRDYFRASREKRFGVTLEEFASGPLDARVAAVRTALEPIRAVLKEQAYLSGPRPLHADYVVAGFLFWWRAISPTQLLEAGDPLTPWFQRILELYPRIGFESTRTWDGP